MVVLHPGQTVLCCIVGACIQVCNLIQVCIFLLLIFIISVAVDLVFSWPYVTTCIRRRSFVRHKVRQSYISRTV